MGRNGFFCLHEWLIWEDKCAKAGRQIRMNPMDSPDKPNWDFSTNIFCHQNIGVVFFIVFGPSIFSGGFDDVCNFPSRRFTGILSFFMLKTAISMGPLQWSLGPYHLRETV